MKQEMISREKQIEEMARYCCNACEMGCGFDGECCVDNDYKTCNLSLETATAIYEAGYRKQNEGEWDDSIIGFCNVCMSCGAIVERSAIKNNSGKLNFCPNCGNKMKMKGGEG